MIIEEEDFRMELSSGNSWDLELLKVVKPKGKPERNEFKTEGFGMSLERCLQIIINYRLGKRKDVYSLQEYVNEYKKEIKNLKEMFKEF